MAFLECIPILTLGKLGIEKILSSSYSFIDYCRIRMPFIQILVCHDLVKEDPELALGYPPGSVGIPIPSTRMLVEASQDYSVEVGVALLCQRAGKLINRYILLLGVYEHLV